MRDSDASVFSPPDRLPILFHDLDGGRAKNLKPDSYGSPSDSMPNSAIPPPVKNA